MPAYKHKPQPTIKERFEQKIEKSEGCWIWKGALRKDTGTAVMQVGYSAVSARRVAFELFIGEIPENLMVTDTCKVDACVNPAHLRALTLEERFWSLVDKTPGHGPKGECWIWTAHRYVKGYGAFGIGQKQIRAHRFAYQLQNGPIPEGLIIMHTCDKPPCVRPDHLTAGTHLENSQDMILKGRQKFAVKGVPKKKRKPRESATVQ